MLLRTLRRPPAAGRTAAIRRFGPLAVQIDPLGAAPAGPGADLAGLLLGDDLVAQVEALVADGDAAVPGDPAGLG